MTGLYQVIFLKQLQDSRRGSGLRMAQIVILSPEGLDDVSLVATSHDLQRSGRSIWNSREAHFRYGRALPLISITPFVVAIGVLSVRLARPLRRYLPSWMKPFIEEPSAMHKEFLPFKRRYFSCNVEPLLILMVLGLVLDTAAAWQSGVFDIRSIHSTAWVWHHH